ncbi:Uncharacterized protein TCM_024308 [Theobroma cacao]|uniref:Uncharacterized protein n=1 Tax=Theobroma cacao TaxID=3641 RepID=A0A061EVY5_THECC|nr:Uncharacterized protein TCM_024308 [Theobroma cacao]
MYAFFHGDLSKEMYMKLLPGYAKLVFFNLSNEAIDKIKQSVNVHLKYLGPHHYFLGLELSGSTQGICGKMKYVLDVIADISFSVAKLATSLMEQYLKLTNADGKLLLEPSS